LYLKFSNLNSEFCNIFNNFYLNLAIFLIPDPLYKYKCGVEIVYSYNTSFNNKYYNTRSLNNSSRAQNVAPVEDSTKRPSKSRYNTQSMMSVPFNPAFSASNLRTRLSSNTEKNKYNELQKTLDRQGRKSLDNLLKSGILLNSESCDNSTVLDNLHNMLTRERAEGLDAKSLVKDVVTALDNPHVITQQFGDIPVNFQNAVLFRYMQDNKISPNDSVAKQKASNEINVTHSGTCVAASIEFNLAKKAPAEFARFAEGLSSKNIEVEKNIHLDKLADNTLDAIWLLNAFDVPYEMNDFNTAKLTFKPDKNAITRAQIQTTNKDSGERSPVDVLMQSTFMQIGSQQTYNSLTDKRTGKFNQNDKGLIEFEKTFTESVVEDKNKISVTYQTVDENARLVGYETDRNTLKRHLTSALDMGENVILGYTQTDNNNIIINGHEITLTGYKKNSNGKLTFICNDTDDDLTKPIEYSEDYLLPKIHHAALPQSVVAKDIQLVENWVEGMKSYNEMKQQQKAVSGRVAA